MIIFLIKNNNPKESQESKDSLAELGLWRVRMNRLGKASHDNIVSKLIVIKI